MVVLVGTDAHAAETVQSQYPRLATGVLTHARLGDLPPDVLLQCGEMKITRNDVNRAVQDASEYLRDQLKKNGFFVLEREATRRIILLVAKASAAPATGAKPKTDRELIQEYLDRQTKDVAVADKDVAQFYAANQSLLGGAQFDQVKDSIHAYLLAEARRACIDRHIRELGKQLDIVVNAAWTKEQAAQAMDNPVDKARTSGRPALVAFSSAGAACCGPGYDAVPPLLDAVQERWGKNLTVVHIDLGDEVILAERYGIEANPTLILYNKAGDEVSRWERDVELGDISQGLAKIGIK